VTTAWAQGGEPSPPVGQVAQPYDMLFPLLMIGAIFYFLVIRPEQRRRKQLQGQIEGLKRNDQVVLQSGIHGRVLALGDKVLSIEIAPKVSVQVDREAVGRVLTAPSAETRDKE
jgi:preprotein translocase subunit YajC